MTDRSSEPEPAPDQPRLSRRAVLATATAGVVSPALARDVAGRDRSDRAGTATATGYGTGGYGAGGYGGTTGSGPGDVTGNGSVATDPDADGTYEDVTGDERFDVLDVAAFLDRFDGIPAEDEQYFDFNEDGTVNILDVAELLEET